MFDKKEALYPFGYGLTYTSFQIGAPTLSSAKITPDGKVNVTVNVRNTGKRAGDETVQTYVRDKASSVTRPVKDLRAFKRITLAAGASPNVTFTPDEQAFRMWKAV